MKTLTSKQTLDGAPEGAGRRLFLNALIVGMATKALTACGGGGSGSNEGGGDGGGNKPPEDLPLGNVPYTAEGYLSTKTPTANIEDVLSAADVDPALHLAPPASFDATLVNVVLSNNANKYSLAVALVDAKNPVEGNITLTLPITGKNAQGQNVSGNVIVTVKLDTVPPDLVSTTAKVDIDSNKKSVQLSDLFKSKKDEEVLSYDVDPRDLVTGYTFDKATGTFSWDYRASDKNLTVIVSDEAGNITKATLEMTKAAEPAPEQPTNPVTPPGCPSGNYLPNGECVG